MHHVSFQGQGKLTGVTVEVEVGNFPRKMVLSNVSLNFNASVSFKEQCKLIGVTMEVEVETF